MFSFKKKEHKPILHRYDGILDSRELLIVLGRPGSGCSTPLKTMTGQLHGLHVGEKSTISYNRIPQKEMIKEFKGETTYNQEVDRHFPHLTVGQTLEFAAAVRTPSTRVHGISRDQYIKQAARIVMAVCGLSHTYNTKVGNDFIRGVSGGERKRVSISEMMLAGAPVGAWDNSAHAVAIYQASQAIYDLFDKAVVLYEGRQIYFGPARDAKAYFERIDWEYPERQTTGDFLTLLTNPQERIARAGMENKVPRTSAEFETYWFESPEYRRLRDQIDRHQEGYPIDPHGQTIEKMREQKKIRRAKHLRPKSPYTVSIAMQVKLCTKRAYQRIWNDKSATGTQAVIHVVMALIIGSVFYGTPDITDGLFAKGSVLFQAILLNALTAISEINNLYSQRPIVEKHASYAFYHPATEAAAGIVSDIPVKFITAVFFNIILYFLAGLRRDAGAFFLYFLIIYISSFIISAIFRTLDAVTKTISQAIMLAGVMVLALVIYTGFIIRVPQIVVWFSWIRWINPIYYAFEILIANEFHGRDFPCPNIVPPYQPLVGDSWICTTVGAIAGQAYVTGDAFIETNFEYYWSRVWRNLGILFAFLIAFMIGYFIAAELNSTSESTAEVLVFRRGVVYDVPIKGGNTRRLLNHRTTTGVITGDMLVNGKPLDASFQRKTGYVQQQGLHLATATVRESLRFSAILRQPKSVSKKEKYDFVKEVIDMLNMRDFADAVIGIADEGLNVEQHKLLTISIELAAKPKLLLFLNKPTSGLDLQTGGKIIYFGNISENSRTLLDYFKANSTRKCGEQENPAEYILEVINKGANPQGVDWYDVWHGSSEREAVMQEIEHIHAEKAAQPVVAEDEASGHSEFAMSFAHQLWTVTVRVFQQYWRTLSYIVSKFILATAAGLFIGFSFF
ncbi:ABC-2 type transporter-domain-containing protein [Ilyonectria sp. MPI-CAGE-AT-0026]|nr:ABC-2 type transporter-domain-containing protein [Ilyonectria sp. MPI-CAGE-AT-0026]